MALYRFKVSDSTGRTSTVLIEGDSQAEATRRVRSRGMMPLQCLGEGSGAGSEGTLPGLGQRFDVVDFTDRLVPLLDADIPLERSLAILGEGMENVFAGQLISDLRRGLHEGRKFSQLIRDRGQVFPRLYANVVEAGEEAGALPAVIGQLHRFLTQSREFKGFLISASIYPVIVLLVSLAVLGVLLGVIVPKFAEVLVDSGQALSFSTQFLLGVSDGVRSGWWVGLVLVAGVAILFSRIRHEGRAKAWWDSTVLKLPMIHRMATFSEVARFCRTLSILMRSGVPLLDAVSIATRVLQNSQFRQSLSSLEGELRQGQRLSQALANSRYLPSFVLRMVAVGEETGAVDSMLERIADRYEADLKRMVARLMSLFEPILIVSLGVVVGTIVLLMFLAIMDMQAGI